MSKFLKKIFAHKIILSVVIVAVAVGGYFVYQKFNGNGQSTVRYVTSVATNGNIIVSVAGTGQVSVSNQVDIKPKASGQITYVGVTVGQEVKAGTSIAQIDASDALKSVRDAKANLESAKLSLDKFVQPPTELDLIQAQNNVEQAKQAKANAEDSLNKDYESGFNTVASTFLNLPTIMSGIDDILLADDFTNGQANMYYYSDAVEEYDPTIVQYRDDAYNAYQKARKEYDQNFQDYKNTNRNSNQQEIDNLINEIYNTSRDVAEAVKSIKNFIDFYVDLYTKNNSHAKINSIATGHQSSLETYTGQTSGFLSSLLSAKSSISNDKQSITNDETNIKIKTETLNELLAGPDSLDLQSQQLSLKQKQNSLLDAQEKLADYYVRAPFDGVIAVVDAKKGDTASSGTAVATIITKQKIAEISLNEIDAARIKKGQKATLTFDAIDALSITGEVAEIDTLGTVSQGVVSYNVKIAFDVQDDRVKPGMSLSVNIITDSKQDVLVVPVSVVKISGNSSYVEILVDGQPVRKTVITGLSNDTEIEIVDGLQAGDEVITSTVTSGKSTATTQSSSQPTQRGGAGSALFELGR